jgi:hypothetical protein
LPARCWQPAVAGGVIYVKIAGVTIKRTNIEFITSKLERRKNNEERIKTDLRTIFN